MAQGVNFKKYLFIKKIILTVCYLCKFHNTTPVTFAQLSLGFHTDILKELTQVLVTP